MGFHAITRSLPTAAPPGMIPGRAVGELPGDVAALTHDHPEAWRCAHDAAVAAVALMQHPEADSGTAPEAAVRAVAATSGARAAHPLTTALSEGRKHGPDPEAPRHHADVGTAPAALAGACRVLGACPEPDSLTDALTLAATPPAGGTAALAGALLGAWHGAHALPTRLLARLDLAWVVDTLARDLVLQFTESPSGGEYVAGTDPHWQQRYFG